MVFIDDSHASGFIGKTGRGTHEHFGVVGKIDVITTTLGKALGGASGGCVSGRKEIVELCRQKADPISFPTPFLRWWWLLPTRSWTSSPQPLKGAINWKRILNSGDRVLPRLDL